jgi:urease accessory protein UreF
VDAYSHSHGLEAAMDDGRVTTRVALVDYIATGRAAEAGGDAALDEIALLAAA